MSLPLLKPKSLKPGATLGVFAPSVPAHVLFREKYQHGVVNLQNMGFAVVEGDLVRAQASQGYRAASARERAREFMALIEDPRVDALISVIGGYNSSSLIPYLNFQKIRAARKIICGYSDVTSLHLAILRHAGLSTFYGPAVMPSFGEFPDVPEYTRQQFLSAVSQTADFPRPIFAPRQWSAHFRDAGTPDWKTLPREWRDNAGWRTLNAGEARAPLLVANLSTLMSNAGTTHFPDLEGVILLIETMSGNLATEERLLRHLDLLGAFDKIAGLIFGKMEHFSTNDCALTYTDLIWEIVGKRDYPIVTEFDCSHTVPMLTLAEKVPVFLRAEKPNRVEFVILEAMVED